MALDELDSIAKCMRMTGEEGGLAIFNAMARNNEHELHLKSALCAAAPESMQQFCDSSSSFSACHAPPPLSLTQFEQGTVRFSISNK